jgi:hypothetical protein
MGSSGQGMAVLLEAEDGSSMDSEGSAVPALHINPVMGAQTKRRLSQASVKSLDTMHVHRRDYGNDAQELSRRKTFPGTETARCHGEARLRSNRGPSRRPEEENHRISTRRAAEEEENRQMNSWQKMYDRHLEASRGTSDKGMLNVDEEDLGGLYGSGSAEWEERYPSGQMSPTRSPTARAPLPEHNDDRSDFIRTEQKKRRGEKNQRQSSTKSSAAVDILESDGDRRVSSPSPKESSSRPSRNSDQSSSHLILSPLHLLQIPGEFD